MGKNNILGVCGGFLKLKRFRKAVLAKLKLKVVAPLIGGMQQAPEVLVLPSEERTLSKNLHLPLGYTVLCPRRLLCCQHVSVCYSSVC